MLEYIRNSAQSFWVKVAFGVIILVFVFWGVGNFNERDYTNVVAVVNGQAVTALEFEKAYHNAEEYLLRQNPKLTRQELAAQHLGRQVLRELIQATLLEQEAQRVGVEVTPLEMRAAVAENQAFQDKEGRFDPDAYRRILEAQRIAPADFEHDLRRDLTRDKLHSLLTASVWVDENEPRNRYDFIRESRKVEYRFLPARDFLAKAQVTEAEARTWYDGHKEEFAIPPKVQVEYINVAPDAIVRPESISAEAARAWYEANRSRFEVGEGIRAHHLLIQGEDADRARKILEGARAELSSGADFGAVADRINKDLGEDKKLRAIGQDLGWVGRGETVPEFEQAAFALEPGKVSEVVESPFGQHLIKVDERRPAGVRPFAEVEAEARKALAIEEGSDRLHEVLDGLIEDNILGKNLAQAAEKYGLKAEDTGLLDKAELMKRLGVDAGGADALLATPAGAPLDTALEAGQSYIVARVLKSDPAGTEEFGKAQEGLMKRLAERKAMELAMAEAGAELKKMSGEKGAAKGLKEATVERGGSLGDFGADAALNTAIFAARPGSWLDRVYRAQGPDGEGALMVRVDSAKGPAPGEYEGVAEIMANAVRTEREDAVFGMFMQELAGKAKVEITNPQLVDRER